MSDDVRGVAVARGDAVAERRGTHESAAAVTFSVMWAIAVLFHIFSGPMRFEAFPEPTALGVNLLALGGVAVAVLFRSRDPRLFVLLAALQLSSVWLETPRLGNHWLVGGFVSLAVLASAASVWCRDRRLTAAELFHTFAPAARWILLVFYAFAAFAKLNQDFLDPAVSCATFFAQESLAVFGLDHLVAGGVSRAVIAGTILVELAVPVMLVVRRTRTVGVVLAVGFHTLLAADLAHPFFDFSSLLLALFVLLLPPGFAGWLRSKVTARGRAGRLLEAGAHLMIVVVAVLLLAALGPTNRGLAVLTLAGPTSCGSPTRRCACSSS
ncbi:MAG: HTTM domain-containing protein [Actinomycetota bacterium]|nr:HTTM domain-containing protein [Actinomycetota bacterium]